LPPSLSPSLHAAMAVKLLTLSPRRIIHHCEARRQHRQDIVETPNLTVEAGGRKSLDDAQTESSKAKLTAYSRWRYGDRGGGDDRRLE
jgi:hypothetical protein